MQYDALSAQMPAWQKCEQQSPLALQGLPEVRQLGLSAWQFPPTQLPLQQPALAVQACASGMHAELRQTPLQLKLQQSVATAQGRPPGVQLDGKVLALEAHICAVGSQVAEQQLALVAQDCPFRLQEAPPSPPRPKPPSGEWLLLWWQLLRQSRLANNPRRVKRFIR